ncbi:High mobility group, superfamily [Cordyceps militaris CM01]|uniref:High mobility group, superfamily n=1 Tax=Cordyceps militaris (strain CM01) TaxID=983644 RepID=G3J5P1_CORMM|nr:High mobility group, superfamily [Cordyceps militaris CM01]EGX96897.1 High mobility group, superfamily [Cordyceps militaris CM01]
MPRRLESVFAELGLAQYLDAFVDQGFDSWETILDIQESDLDALGVKLGHRRKLQRRIANARGIAPSVSLVSTLKSGAEDARQQQLRRECATRSEAGSEPTSGVTKRKYRRHPKSDENAPERPPSAYVLFSNKMREDLKSHNLSFTEIAKLVGENWQNLDQGERELYENQANAAKDKYRRSLTEYKKTPEHRRYAQYLQEFKDKQNKHSQGSKAHLSTDTSKRQKVDSKREPGRLRHDSSHGSTTSGGTNGTPLSSAASGTASGNSSERLRESEPPPYRRRRVDSIASIAESQVSSTAPTALSQRNSLDENGLSPRNSHLDGNSPIDGRHSQHAAMWYDRSNHSDSSKMPQQLPSLSDMLDKDNRQGISGRLPPAGSPTMGMGSPVAYPVEDLVRRSGGSKLPDSRPTGDSALPIHALLSSQASPNPLYAKAPLRSSNMPLSKDALEHPQGPPGYGFLSNSPTFRHMKTEQSGDGDVVMTTERSPPSAGEKGRFDGMSALLQAGEIVGRRGSRR